MSSVGKKWWKCHKLNHFTSVCNASGTRMRVGMVDGEENEEEFTIDIISKSVSSMQRGGSNSRADEWCTAMFHMKV